MSPRSALAVLILAAAPLCAEMDTEPAAPVLRLVWADPTDTGAGSELMAREEAAALISRMGVKVSWRRGTPGEQMQKGEVWVILVGEGPAASSDTIVLGATKLGAVCPTVWVRVPNVRRAVDVPRGPSLIGLAPFERRMVSVAIGRVIAHEIVHVIAPSVPHGSGLTAANLTRRQLRSATIAVDAEVALAVRAAFKESPLSMPPPAGVLAAQSEVPAKDR